MSSFSESFYLDAPGRLRRLVRDIRFIGYLAHVIWYYVVFGGRVRREYRRCQERGEIYRIDSLSEEDI